MAPDTNQPPKHSVSVAAAILDDAGRFLVIRRADNGRWEPPGGVLELDESITDGLIREVREETGLDVRPARAHRRLQEHEPRHRRPRLPLRDRRRRSPHHDEAREFAWLTPDELSDRMSRPIASDCWTHSRATLRQSIRQAHDGTAILE